LITTFAEIGETQPTEFVTVKLYVPDASAETIVLVVDPEIFPGFKVQLPEGSPVN